MAKANYQKGQADAIKQAMMKKYTQTMYCVFCGKPVIACSTDEHGKFNSNVEWELENSAHYPCFIKDMQKRQGY